MPFPRALAQSEKQADLIWTQIANFISYDDDHYAKFTL